MIEWFSVTLRCYHPEWDPGQISTQLGMTPEVSWKAGDQRRIPSGETLSGRCRSTYWCSSKLLGSWDHPIATLTEYIKLLEGKREFIQNLISSGGRIEFFLGWGLPGPSGGQVLDVDLLGRLGSLGINLAIDVYAKER